MRLNESFLVRVFPVLLLALVLGPVVGRAQEAGSQGRSIEFSSPNGAGTNLFNQFFSGRLDEANPLSDDLFTAPHAVVPVGSLNGVLPPQRVPLPSAVQKKLRKASMENKDWFLANPDDPLSGTTPEEIFNLPGLDAGDSQLESQSPVERYLMNQAAKKQAAVKAKMESQQNEAARSINGIQRLLDPSNGGLNRMDSSLPPGVPAVFAPQTGSGYLSQGYGQNDYNPKPTAPDTAQKALMEEFNKMIGMTEADNPHKSPLTSPLNSGSPNSVGSDWNPYSSSYQAAPPKKSPLPEINTSGAVPKPATPVVAQPAKTSVEEQNQPLFAPAFSIPRRRVQ